MSHMPLLLFSSSSPCLPTRASPCGFVARRYEENTTSTQIRRSGNTFSARGVVVSCGRQGTYGTRYRNFVSLVTLKRTQNLLDLLFASLLDVSALSALVFILFSIFNIHPIPHAVDPAKHGNGAVAVGSLKRGSTSATRYSATNSSRLAKAVVTGLSIVFGDTVTLLTLLG
jgi:hypothetical protein